MIGGLFIYNHKGEVLISRVYRDDVGWEIRITQISDAVNEQLQNLGVNEFLQI